MITKNYLNFLIQNNQPNLLNIFITTTELHHLQNTPKDYKYMHTAQKIITIIKLFRKLHIFFVLKFFAFLDIQFNNKKNVPLGNIYIFFYEENDVVFIYLELIFVFCLDASTF